MPTTTAVNAANPNRDWCLRSRHRRRVRGRRPSHPGAQRPHPPGGNSLGPPRRSGYHDRGRLCDRDGQRMTERVLVVRADNLGDVVLTGPAVRAVRASGANVVMLCSPAGIPIANRLPGVEHVIQARLPWIDAEPDPVERSAVEDLVTAVQRTGCREAL